MKRYYYSADLLRKSGACNEWVSEFKRTFGTGRVELTPKFCQALLNRGFPVRWPACRLWIVLRPDTQLGRDARTLYDKSLYCHDASELYHLLVQTAELWARYHGGER